MVAHLAIIIRSSYNRNQKVYEKLNFSGIVVKAAESHFAWFCSLLQMSWPAEKVQ